MDLGSRVEFHCHSIFSDGELLPAALIREAEMKGHSCLAITDHIDASNIESVIKALTLFAKKMKGKLPIKFIPGVEVSYLQPQHIAEYCKKARALGAKIIVVHGQSPVEPVYPGTNFAAVKAKGYVDILAHPGKITDEEAALAAKNGVFLELTARQGHKKGNQHIAKMALKHGAKLIVDTDCHHQTDLITQEQAFALCKEAGLSDKEAIKAIKDNPQELLKRIGR
ncbi:MAG: histidinol phosphate phosphatase domain-containing protein [bacterium]